MKTRPSKAQSNLIVKPAWNPVSRDDASLSSTLTADTPPRKPLRSADRRKTHRLPAPPTCPLRVRFAEEKNSYFANETVHREECQDFWYTADDLARFKESIIRTIKTLHKYEAKNPSSGSVQNVLEATYQCCFEQDQETARDNILPRELSAAIKNQYRHNDEYLLGMERFIVRRISRDRQELRKCLMEIVLNLQKGDWPDKQVLAENIARVSAEATRSSRLFARQLGSAQVPYLLTRRPS